MFRRVLSFLILFCLFTLLLAGCSKAPAENAESSQWTLGGQTVTVNIPDTVSLSLANGQLDLTVTAPAVLDLSGLEALGFTGRLTVRGTGNAKELRFPEAQVCGTLAVEADIGTLDLSHLTHGESVELIGKAEEIRADGAKLGMIEVRPGHSISAFSAAENVSKIAFVGANDPDVLSDAASIPGVEEIFVQMDDPDTVFPLAPLAEVPNLTALRLVSLDCDLSELAAFPKLAHLQVDATVGDLSPLGDLTGLEDLVLCVRRGEVSGQVSSATTPEAFAAWSPDFDRAPIDRLAAGGTEVHLLGSYD